MNPPLREAADRDAMIAGIVDGTVDAIATDHAPHHYDEKQVEFDRAPFGIVGLETAVSLTFDRLLHSGLVRLPRLVELLSSNPAQILKIPGGTLAVGAVADISILAPGSEGARGRAVVPVALQEHAVRRLGAPRRRRRDDRRRPHGVHERGGGAEEPMNRPEEIREKALDDLQRHEVLMLNGHFDFGNGYHGRVYLNPHQLFRHPSTIWRFAQDLLDIIPKSIVEQAEVVAGPVMGGALLAHTMAGLLDSRQHLSRPRTVFAPFSVDAACGQTLSRFYQQQVKGRTVLLVDDVLNTGQTFARCADLVRSGGGTVIATAEIYDRMEAIVKTGRAELSRSPNTRRRRTTPPIRARCADQECRLALSNGNATFKMQNANPVL